MVNVDTDRDAVIAWLREHGFDAAAIDEGAERRPDILATFDHPYLIEVKRRLDREGAEEFEEQQVEAQGYAYFLESLRPSRRYYRQIRDLVEQLDGDHRDAIRLGWMICAGDDIEDQATFIEIAAFGAGCVADADRTEAHPEPASIMEAIAVQVTGFWCDYFYESSFFRARNSLDGLLLDVGGELRLLVNDHSPGADRLRASALAAHAAVVIDPAKRPDPDRLYADSMNPRNDVRATLEHLGAKYEFTQPIEIDMQRHRLRMRVPNPGRS